MSGSGGGGGESGGETVGFGSLPGEHIVVGAESKDETGRGSCGNGGSGRRDGCSGKIEEA
jgi:hypothetical protein